MPPTTRANGRRSRRAILDHSLALAALGGRPTASIGALATALGMSKSGVFAHFGSKDALDLAMIDAAAERFAAAVLAPAEAAPAGLARLAALCEGFLVYVAGEGERPRLTPAHRAFGHGLGIAADARRRAWSDAWRGQVAQAAADAVTRREMAATCEPAQVAFELTALLEGAGWMLDHLPAAEVIRRTRLALDRALVGWSDA